jgi:hypothetical protein
MIIKTLPMQVAAGVVAGLRQAVFYYPAALIDALIFFV